MLSLSNVGSGENAANYYETADDYYSGNRSASEWWGIGATALGLSDQVDPIVFAALLNGQLSTGEQLHNAAAGRRGGTDATFSAPKSVSLQALIGGDTRLIEAHRRAVDKSLSYMEQFSACRVTENGVTRTDRTSNLIVARFEHDLSRACDPQLHTHCVIINATQRKDGQWRAMDNEPIYRQKMLFGALYRAELAREMQELGYSVRLTHLDGRFELDHINEKQVRAFSQRSVAIEAYLQKHKGLEREQASAWDKKLIAVITRDKKTAVDREQLYQDWDTLSRAENIDYSRPTNQRLAPALPAATHAVLVEALAHLSERESVFTHTDLLRTMLERGVGCVNLDEILAIIETGVEEGELIRHGERYTTPAAQVLEAEILTFERQGRSTVTSIYQADRATLLSQLQSLSGDQQKAVLGILLSKNSVMGIQGRAGVGKTTLLRAAANTATKSGYTMIGLAPSASATRELASTGIAAQTIAAFTHRTTKGLDEKTILIVDEAGMVSTVQMHNILSAAMKVGCRVVLVGDTAQLKAVEAGKPFAQLQANGMNTSVVAQIQRQTNIELKRAVELSVEGQISMAVELLDKQIVQIINKSDRFDRIAHDFSTLSSTERAQTRVIAGTRYARNEINSRIRAQLSLSGAGQTFTLLERKDHTKAQRRSILSYETGDIVLAEKEYPSLGMKRGEIAKVLERSDNRILLERSDGKQVAWHPAITTMLTAYVPVEREIAQGELVRVTANDHMRGLINGDLATITAVDAERQTLKLLLADGRTVELDGSQPIALDYGYCSTVYSAQGQTCDRVLIEADSNSMTAQQSTFYVSISRARKLAQLYTDDREMLPLAMSREYEKASALDISHPNPRLNFEIGM